MRETLVRLVRDTNTVVSEPQDAQVHAGVLVANADLIVSSDANLLNLKRFHGIDTVASAEAMRHIDRSAQSPE